MDEVPFQGRGARLFVLEPLEFLDEVQLELGAEPGTELEGDVTVGIGAAVTARLGVQAGRGSGAYPLLRG